MKTLYISYLRAMVVIGVWGTPNWGTITMPELIEPVLAPEIYVDGFSDYEVRDGILTCAGYRIQKGTKVAVLRIVMPVANLGQVIQRALEAAQGIPLPEHIAAMMPPKTAH